MPRRIGINQLRETLTATLRRVERGETIEVTNRGLPVAILAPVPADRVDRLVAAGVATPGEPLERALRRYPVVGELSASQAIEDDRA
jgi:prevent-host-death family protein